MGGKKDLITAGYGKKPISNKNAKLSRDITTFQIKLLPITGRTFGQ